MRPGSENDTICAQATPPGHGAISIVRLSGPQAIAIAHSVFLPHSRQQSLLTTPSHTLVFGHLIEPSERTAIDDVLVAVMRGPHSYTGEDVVEINCHGAPTVVQRTVRLLLAHGARLAEPGEFTRRAFEHGQIDLAQAEAVCDLITAQTRRAAEMALRQLQGALSARLGTVRALLLDLLAEIEAHLDFPEEDFATLQLERWRLSLESALTEVQRLAAEGERGHLLRMGARVVLVGKPNAGKSSLFNRLLGQERAIVTPEPGTTRDSLDSLIEIAGLPLTVVDTAGLRAAVSEVERLGVERTEREIGRATQIVVCVPCDEPWGEADELVWRIAGRAHPVVALTKCDLPRRLTPEALAARLDVEAIVETSAVTGEGIEALIERVGARLLDGFEAEEAAGDPLVTSERHIAALRAAAEALGRARQATGQAPALELIAADLRAALAQVDQILGLEVSDEILDRIFSRFCIGK